MKNEEIVIIKSVELDRLTSVAGIVLAGISLILGFIVVLLPVEGAVKIAFLTLSGTGKVTGAAIARYNPK